MGYTHYWYTIKDGISQKKWDAFLNDFEQVLPKFVHLLDTSADQKLQYDGDSIFFNGKGDDAYETFVMHRSPKPSEYTEHKDRLFACCKTAQQPYDIAVCSVLIIAKRHFGDDMNVKSDGNNDDETWIEAKMLCKDVLGYGMLDVGDVYQSIEGKYLLRVPETYGQLLDPVGEMK